MTSSTNAIVRRGVEKLLAIKDSDIRLSVLKQGVEAVDQGVHIGGAFSAVVPMVSVFYGDVMEYDVQDPTRPGQDQFVLSKGHAVATLASIYADLGYFPKDVLKNSRSVDSILNGHPGPLLPGVHIATGPLAQGVAVAQGLAIAGKRPPSFNVFAVTGDGELQEGVAWEAFMHAPQARLDNFCVIVDKNEGQLDNSAQLIFPMDNLPAQIEAFGWNVHVLDGTNYGAVLDALTQFSQGPRNGKPTALVCNTKKGYGSFAFGLNKHKATVSESIFEIEAAQQRARRDGRVTEFLNFLASIQDHGDAVAEIRRRATAMNLKVDRSAVEPVVVPTRSGKVPVRDKAIRYNAADLPSYGPEQNVAANEVVATCMSIFARDDRIVSVDSDLGTTSGLEGGVSSVDQHRGINVGIAESNMMCVGEAFAALGYNAWVSTFCPFFDWKVLRRIAVGQQERLEVIEDADGWLSDGHGLDLTFLATASNFETRVNGATHMGNDDVVVFGGIAGLKMIDVSCPNQLVGVMRWIMDGNRGLTYVRIMRAASGVVHDPGFEFSFGNAYVVSGSPSADVHLVSSGRGVHEAITAARSLAKQGTSVEVVDMPSFDPEFFLNRFDGSGLVVLAEQNNGFLVNQLSRLVARTGASPKNGPILSINTALQDGGYQFIHSATYDQLVAKYGLDADSIAKTIRERLQA